MKVVAHVKNSRKIVADVQKFVQWIIAALYVIKHPEPIIHIASASHTVTVGPIAVLVVFVW